MLKKIFLLVILVIIQKSLFAKTYYQDRVYSRAVIEKIEKIPQVDEYGMDLMISKVHLLFLDGDLSGTKKIIEFQSRSDNNPKEISYEEGSTYFAWITKSDIPGDPAEQVYLGDIDNTFNIILILFIVIISIIAIGHLKGLFSMLSLIGTILLIFFIFVPWTLSGKPPLPMAIFISIISILITLPIISGWKLKTLSAVLGASFGVIISSLLAVFCGWIIHTAGIVTHEMIKVYNISNINIDLKNLSLSAMIIAALGATMDIAVSIASSTKELYKAKPDLPFKDAFKSVLTIGQDILGSMVNTLILAYVGSSLSIILIVSIFIDQGLPFRMIINDNRILSEIVKSAVGSIGMFVTIPITALISVKLYEKKYQKKKAE